MDTEPSVLYQIFDILLQIIVFIIVMGGALFVFLVIDRFFKEHTTDKGGTTFLTDLYRRRSGK